MTNEKPFKASNGWTVKKSELFSSAMEVRCVDGSLMRCLGPDTLETLREFFRHERDTELGRVRWPENPDYVIYRDPEHDDEDGRCVEVLHEPSAITAAVWELWIRKGRRWDEKPSRTIDMAARWYFTEGPGKPERPWENAKSGEVWRLTVDGLECNHVKMLTTFSGGAYKVTPDYAGITAGRKLVNADGTPADD